ncbi:MAG: amidohydrolase [Phycisphaerales bacterium JB040]
MGAESAGAPAGLREAHAHLSMLGRSLSMCDVSGARSAGELLDRLSEHPPDGNGWVIGVGARPEGWDDPRWPTRERLDRCVGGRPALVWCFDYHAMLAGTRALEHAGITRESRIVGGVVETDHDGEPTGVLLEGAAGRLWASLPEATAPERLGHVHAACEHLAALGFVEVHDLKSEAWLGAALARLRAEDRLPVRVGLFPLVEIVERVASQRKEWESDEVSLLGGKIFTDGTLNSRTAWMLEPYSDLTGDRSRGMALMSVDGIAGAIRTCRGLGLGLAAHAIGDGAVRAVLDAAERVGTGRETPTVRIEHAELIDAADVPRFEALGVVCSVQPCHLLPDIEALRRAVPDRLDRVLPLRELLENGLEPGRGLLFGSDVPIVRADPGDSVAGATLRRRAEMPESDAIGLSQALSADECWTCFGRGLV